MKGVRIALAVGVTIVTLAAVPSPALATTVGCTWDVGTRTVTVTMTGGGMTTIRRVGGSIEVEDAPCFGPSFTFATVEGTKRIVVNGDAAGQDLIIALDGGRFAPGYGNEPGQSDEIEFRLRLGGGPDTVGIASTQNDDRIRVGSSNGQVLINLNAAEATGIDADIRADALVRVAVHGGSGNDVISGAGGKATGGVLAVTMTVEGAEGDDKLVGGSLGDNLYDIAVAADHDVIHGRGGNDAIALMDGDGNDEAFGDAGVDACSLDVGDISSTCEP